MADTINFEDGIIASDAGGGIVDVNLEQERVEDIVDALLIGGTNITLSYDDPNDTLTIDAADAAYTDEQAQDAVDAMLDGGTNVTLSYDDANDSLIIDTAALDAEQVEDQVNSLLSSGNAVTLSYDDANNTLTVAVDETAISHDNLANISASDHHAEPSAGTGVTNEGTNQFGLNVIKSGSVTLSSGVATVDTAVSTSNTATFQVALAPDTDDADVAAEVRSDSGTGSYVVDIEETVDTSVGNPTVNYDIIRVR